MQTLKYVIGADRRALVKDVQDFKIDFSGVKNWLQARQYEDGMRYVFVDVTNEDGTPFDLTGCNVMFEGLLPDGTHRIMDAKHSVMIDPTNGQFRFDFPKQAFSLAGSYKQAFFRIMRDGSSVTTLEFSLEVLADKVISGIVPSDYLTPFEELYAKLSDILTNADGEVKAKLLEWQNSVNEIITNLNGSYADIQATVNLIKSSLDALEDKIKQDGLLTQADLNDFKTDINDRISKLEAQEESGELMTDVGGGVREIFRDGINNIRAQIDPNLANIGMITDVHYTDRDNFWGPDNAAETGITHILNIAAISDLLDFAVSCGDNTDDNWSDNHFALKRIMDYGTTWFTSMQCPSAILLGNHDDNSSHANSGKAVGNDYLVPDSYIAKAYRNDLNLYGEHRNGDSNYYYYDIPDKNVRVIGVNDYENPNTLDSSNKLKYPRINTSIITADQIKWLASDALNVDVNTHVMIMMHCPINGTNKDNPAENCINHDVLKQLLEAFVSGKTGTLVGVNADFPVNVDYNFANKGNLIGVFAGHVHVDDYKKINGINYILSLNSVGCSGNQPNVTTYYDTADEDSWAVIGVDTANRHVKMSKFGRGSDMNFDY